MGQFLAGIDKKRHGGSSGWREMTLSDLNRKRHFSRSLSLVGAEGTISLTINTMALSSIPKCSHSYLKGLEATIVIFSHISRSHTQGLRRTVRTHTAKGGGGGIEQNRLC